MSLITRLPFHLHISSSFIWAVSHSNPRVVSGSYEGSKFPGKSKNEKNVPWKAQETALLCAWAAFQVGPQLGRSGIGLSLAPPLTTPAVRLAPASLLARLPGINRPISPDFCRFFGLSWETSTFKNYHPEASKHSGSRRIEFSSKST